MIVLTSKRLKSVCVCATALLSLSVSGAAWAESLSDAIAQAYASNPTLVRQRALQRGTDETYVQARSGLGPTVSLGGSVNYTDHDSTVTGGRSTTALSLSAEQAIFASGGLSAQVDAAEATVMSSQATLKSVETQVVLSVISAYTAVRRDQEALSIAQENYDVLSRQLDQTRAQFEAGQLTRTDVAQAEARLAGSDAALASTRARLDADRATYQALVGQAPVALAPEPDLPGLPAGFDSALSAAESNNPDLQAQLYALESAKANVRAAKSAYGPYVTLGAGVGQSAPTDQLGDLNDSTAAQATLRFSVPLYSSGLNSSRIRAATESYNAQLMTVEATRRQLTSEVSQAWSNMLAARAATSANEKQVQATLVAAQGVRIEQEAGLRTTIEVLNAEQELRSAQLALVEARRNQYVAGSQLLAVMGGLSASAFVSDLDAYSAEAHFDDVRNKGWSPLAPVVRTIDGAAGALFDGE